MIYQAVYIDEHENTVEVFVGESGCGDFTEMTGVENIHYENGLMIDFGEKYFKFIPPHRVLSYSSRF